MVFTSDIEAFAVLIKHITNKTNLLILEESQFLNYPKSQYAIFVSGFINKQEAYKKFTTLYKTSYFNKTKSLAIFPFEIFDYQTNSNLPVNGNLGVVYTGDLLGPRVDNKSDLFMTQTLKEAVMQNRMAIAVGELYYPIFAVSAAKEIVKWIFSFGPYGKEIFLLGTQTSADTIWSAFSKLIPSIEIKYKNGIKTRTVPRGFEIKVVKDSVTECIEESIPWITLVPKTVRPKRRVPENKVIHKNSLNRYVLVSIIILLFLALPFMLLAVSAGLFMVSYKSYLSGRPELSKNLIIMAGLPSYVAREESRLLQYVPFLGKLYEESFFAGDMSNRVSAVGATGISLANSSKDLLTKILGNEVYDPDKYLQEISVNLNYLNAKISEMDAETRSRAKDGSFLAKKALSTIDLQRVRKTTEGASKMAANLSDILGSEKSKTYLVLFQNNMELRPTGGFIGSFGLLTFEGGRMTDLSISDIYSADGQLKGHIEPPDPIKNYLGEANWWFRDSNWDPDFPTSAKRAEWFLDKEVDRSVDGVIAVDLYPIKNSLFYTGPIYLPDYDMDITTENLYEKTQAEAHEDFFPGTHKKASFLTALSRNLISHVGQAGGGGKLGILKVLFDSLEGRHIQIYLHNNDIQSAVSSLNWSGEVATPFCSGNCYTDFTGLVEANLGVNKANYFVSRNQEINVSFKDGKIIRSMVVELKNAANPTLGSNAKYKNYMRVIVPKDAILEDVFEVSGHDSQIISADVYDVRDHREIGFLTEVLAGQSKKILINWKTDFPPDLSNGGEYGFYLRKQAGTGDGDGLSVSIVAPDKTYLYNTALTRDFYTKIIWTNKP